MQDIIQRMIASPVDGSKIYPMQYIMMTPDVVLW